MLRVYDHYKYFYSFSAGIDFGRHNLTSTDDPRFERVNGYYGGWSVIIKFMIIRKFAVLRNLLNLICHVARITGFRQPAQQEQNICLTFIECWNSVKDVWPALFKCSTNVLCLLGGDVELRISHLAKYLIMMQI